MQVQQYLTQHQVPFRTISHSPAFGALRIAQSVDLSGNFVAKTVVLEADGSPVLAVLPATRRVDLGEVRDLLKARDVTLASEQRCQQLFPDCDVGALPPFGAVKGMRTIMDRALADCDDMVFEGNHHDQAIRLRVADYERLEQPMIAHFSRPLTWDD